MLKPLIGIVVAILWTQINTFLAELHILWAQIDILRAQISAHRLGTFYSMKLLSFPKWIILILDQMTD